MVDLFYPDFKIFFISAIKVVSLSYDSGVCWNSSFKYFQELSLFIHKLANWHKRPSLGLILALSLIIYKLLFEGRNVQLFFTWTLKGHCRVSNWLNFNIAVFQGIGTPKERERDGEMAGPWRSQSTHNICWLTLPFYTVRFVVSQNNYIHNIKDPRS